MAGAEVIALVFDFDDALPGFLGSDSVSQSRATLLRSRIEAASHAGTEPR